jgi:ParB family transcriptional regulator, chromosome partitioning protein
VGRRSGLGKGLGALIPAGERVDDATTQLREIPLSQIEPNRYQPRAHFDEEALVTLTASIREVGVLQPILVRLSGVEQYELIAGERRWRAAKRAGLASIPALVRAADDTSSLGQALVENLQRENLNPLEEAAAYQQLLEEFGLTQDDVASQVGRSRSAVANTVRLLQLPPIVQRFVADRALSAGHARALLGSPDRSFQEELATLAVAEELTVREVEDLVRRQVHGDAEPPAAAEADVLEEAGEATATGTDVDLEGHEPGTTKAPALLELERLLADRLDTRVSVVMSAKRGKVIIEFANMEDLERIYQVIAPSEAGSEPGA